MQIDAKRTLLRSSWMDGEGIYESYTGRSRWKETCEGRRGTWGGENMKEKGERMDGADKERDKERDGGVKAAQGGHCWCWNHRLEVKSFENKSNLHHCSAELSDAFHLAPFKTFPPPQQPSKLTTPFPNSSQLSNGEKKNAFKGVRKTGPCYWFTLILIPLFSNPL